jgi:hypothetical protein
MIVVEPKIRLTAIQVLQHPWFKKFKLNNKTEQPELH